MSAKPIRPLATVTGSYTMADTDSCIVASGVKVNAVGADVISLAGVTASCRSLNTNGASLTVAFVPGLSGGVWYTIATQGTVA
jgi:hypothetical protein